MTDTGLVGKVPTEVYLTYEDRAKEIASRSVTETQVAIKNAILRFALEARLSGTASPPAVAAGGVMEALNAAREWINAADHDEHCFTNDPNPDACRCVCDKDSVIALIDDVTAALAVGDEGIREGAKDTVDYVMQYGGRCRDCADENGTCPHSGLPCDTDAARKAIGFVLRAVEYGQRNGYLPTPPSRGEGE